MGAREFLINVVIIAAAMALLALVELIIPLFARNRDAAGRVTANFGLTILTLLMNWALTSAAALFALVMSLEQAGLLARLSLPAPARIAIAVIVLDLCAYLAHVLMHKIPVLWRAHRVHHSDHFVDVSTALRQHPLEGLWRFLWLIGPVWILGLTPAGVIAYRLLSVLQALLEHANIKVWRTLDGLISLVWCTPNMHKIHHSRIQRETDSNYGNILSVFDRAFGTFTPTDRAFAVRYGVDDVDPKSAKSLTTLLAMPFSEQFPQSATAPVE